MLVKIEFIKDGIYQTKMIEITNKEYDKLIKEG